MGLPSRKNNPFYGDWLEDDEPVPDEYEGVFLPESWEVLTEGQLDAWKWWGYLTKKQLEKIGTPCDSK